MIAPRIRVPRQASRGEVIEIKTLISHPMETGYRRDVQGQLLPRHIIQTFTCTYNGVEVFRADWHPAIAANPYLAFAAMLMAGIDGIENKIDPGEPLDKDIYALSPEELKNVPTMPGSLEESLQELEQDHDFLVKGGVFTEDALRTWIDYKMENEVDPMRKRPHPHEFELYFDM